MPAGDAVAVAPGRGSKDDSASALVVGQWIVQNVGIGHTFTIEDLRRAFPGVNQVDRRMRDLRPMGWELPHVGGGLYRLVKVGGTEPVKQVSQRVRREVFDAAQWRCQVCGVGAGEPYPDDPDTLCKLQLGHWVPKGQAGHSDSPANLRAECQKCNEGIRDKQGAVVTAASVRARAIALPKAKRRQLVEWMQLQRREQDAAEKLWYEWRQLPPVEQAALLDELVARDESGAGTA